MKATDAGSAPAGRKLTSTATHIMALDGIVNVNSLFTLAVFLGLAIDPADPANTLVSAATDGSSCLPSPAVAEGLVTSHVYSFSSFLFSSLVACSLKQAIRTARQGDSSVQIAGNTIAHVNMKVLRAGIMASAAGSASGFVFLTLALVDLVRIKLGTSPDCSGWYGFAAIVSLATLVPAALAIYICVALHAFTR